MNNKDFIFKESRDGIKFIGNFEEYYKHEPNPWNQNNIQYSRNRKWMLLNYLKDIYPKPNNILDVGCGLGHMVILLRELVAPTCGVDVSKTCIDEARKLFPLGEYEVCDIRKSFPSGTFDIIVLNHILWYILPELDKIISKSIDHLTANGSLIIAHQFIKDQRFGKDIINGFHGLINSLEIKHKDKFKITGFKFNEYRDAIISLRRITNG